MGQQLDTDHLRLRGSTIMEDTSSIGSCEEASSLCSNLSWSSAEISFKRLRIQGPTSSSHTSSSLSDFVIVEGPQTQTPSGLLSTSPSININPSNDYSCFNNYLGQLHAE